MNQKPAVLYVEDDPMSRTVMDIMLCTELQLENVAILPDSQDFEANIHALTFDPDIIFLDIHMEPLTGFEMLAQLRQHPRFQNQPIVALTASVMNEEVAQLKDAGFNGVIPKPIDLDTFPAMMQSLLQGEEIWRVISSK